MKIPLIQIGNSKGIRLPKSIIEQCHFDRVVVAEIRNGKLILSSKENSRQGWDEAFKAMAKAGDDELIDPEIFDLPSDDEEWKW